MGHIDRQIQFLQELQDRFVVMARFFQEDGLMFKRAEFTHAFEERLKSFPAIRKCQSRTGFKALMAFEKGFGNKASDVPRFSNINTKKQGFMLQQWNGLESLFRLSGHGLHPPTRELTEHDATTWVDRPVPVETPLP
jgi:hypothetical protein